MCLPVYLGYGCVHACVYVYRYARNSVLIKLIRVCPSILVVIDCTCRQALISVCLCHNHKRNPQKHMSIIIYLTMLPFAICTMYHTLFITNMYTKLEISRICGQISLEVYSNDILHFLLCL